MIRAGSPGVPPATWALAALGIVLIAGFVMHQRVRARLGRPTLVETSLFRHPAFGAALAVSAVFFASSVGLSMVIVLHVQVGLGDGPLAAAATLLPWPAAMAVANYAAGRLLPRFGARVLTLGLLVELAGVAGAVAAYGSAPGRYPTALLPALAVAGAGAGLFTRTFFGVSLARVSHQEAGSAAGLLNAAQQLGQTLGVALLTTTFLRAAHGGAPSASTGAAIALGAVAALLLAALALSRRMVTDRTPVRPSVR